LTAAHEQRAHNARYALDLIQPGVGDTGLVLQQIKHLAGSNLKCNTQT
jgi:transposase